jgi:hypothetical protein
VKWPWQMRKTERQPDMNHKRDPSPELERVRSLVREAAILGPQVERELAERMRRGQ